ncbi:probable arabinosyltransferase ARAD1 [Salvia miltiorrhiza]|uniref:probable arabinosyltransferase ARAD1 n=1 Tax=Salvia miltiorrhiza TaxID=226208 RepID=UPI0025AD9440|nr:probable arabinosyltransferase ARAD1 [Salvia miltiorrhiza]
MHATKMSRNLGLLLLLIFLIPTALVVISSLNMLRPNAASHFIDEATKCSTNNHRILKVFMYNLPPVFHFGLLGWKGNGHTLWPDLRRRHIPQYPGGLNLQHSVEYWLTLDILSSQFSKNLSGRSAVRVGDSRQADVVFVPFFASISYNRFGKNQKRSKKSADDMLQEKLVHFLVAQEEWKRSGGRDHIIVAHHPNSLLYARMKLWPAIFILADLGRYPPSLANVDKDVIAPYNHLIPAGHQDSGFHGRPTLLYFQGAVYRKDGGTIRQELFYMLRDEKDVHFTFGSIKGDGINQASKGMHASKFCLNIAGDTPSSNRLFDAIASHCVPVIISDDIELPFEDILDYTEFCVFVSTADALRDKFLINFIRGISKEEWSRMWRALKQVEHYFEFQYPSQKNDAVQMIWQAISRKIPATKRKVNRASRLSRMAVAGERRAIAAPLPRNFW